MIKQFIISGKRSVNLEMAVDIEAKRSWRRDAKSTDIQLYSTQPVHLSF